MGAKRPSLNALRALEATVRLSSMTAAAEELSVTHGAVSRHIKSLEEMFGIPLLLRGPRSVQATPEGGRLASELSRAFALIASSVEQLQPSPLTLSCSSTIMMSWQPETHPLNVYARKAAEEVAHRWRGWHRLMLSIDRLARSTMDDQNRCEQCFRGEVPH